MKKLKAHTQYKLADGTRVPSVTTVLGILGKNALIEWAYQCGLRGEDYKAVRDNAADIGTLAHYLIMCHIKGIAPDVSEYSQQDITKAETCTIKYLDWEKEHPITPLMVEEPLVSDQYGFGGTLDCVALLNQEVTLIDFKTSKGIYPDMFYQLAAYHHLISEVGHLPGTVKSCRILRIGKDETQGFEERVLTDLSRQWKLFLHCLEIYKIQKEIKKGGK